MDWQSEAKRWQKAFHALEDEYYRVQNKEKPKKRKPTKVGQKKRHRKPRKGEQMNFSFLAM